MKIKISHNNNKVSDIIRDPENNNKIVVLSVVKVVRIPLRKFLKYSIISFFILYFVLGFVSAPSNGVLFAASNDDIRRVELESQLADLENQINQYEKEASGYRAEGNILESEVRRLNSKIAKLNLEIKAIIANIDNLDGEITTTKNKIVDTESDIGAQRNSLSQILQDLYQSENKGAIEIMMENLKISDFVLNLNSLLVLQDSVRDVMEKMVQLKNNLISQKETLALEYEDADQLMRYQEDQRASIKNMEVQKSSLLNLTKQQEQDVVAKLEKKKKTAAEIRSQIFELIGGGELSFGEAYKLAKAASDATSVDASLILAILDGESALGKNVGKCEYDKNPYYPDQASNKTTMKPTRDIQPFLAILSELKNAGISAPNPPLVSCPIPRDGAYGGAMGPAQFIPSTWILYKDRVASISGHRVASPWNNQDAFIATALYLSDAYNSSSCVKYANDWPQYDSNMLKSRCAAAKYYAGGNWYKFRLTYGNRTLEKASEFQNDIDILNY